MVYDVLIIGLGCAGYTSAIYAARYKLNTFLVGSVEGGLGITAAEVGNWPGNIEIAGPDLMENFKKHALSFSEVTNKVARVEKIDPGTTEGTGQGIFTLHLDDGTTVQGKTIIFAMGSNKRHLNVPGEERLSGKGVTYCATSAPFTLAANATVTLYEAVPRLGDNALVLGISQSGAAPDVLEVVKRARETLRQTLKVLQSPLKSPRRCISSTAAILFVRSRIGLIA